MKKIFAINGSLRKHSANGELLKSIGQMPTGHSFSIYDSLDLLPHFSPDIKIPRVVVDFRKRVSAADYFLIRSPEYAHGIPGVLKNALDWLVSDEDIPGKEIVLFICGAGDGRHAMEYIKEVLSTMSLSVCEGRCLTVAAIQSKVCDGEITDLELKSSVESIFSALSE